MTDDSAIITGQGGTTFVGPDGVALFRAVALKNGLSLYAKTGMKPNRMWTPSAMLRAAGQLTGKHYKRGAYLEAATDLGVWINTMRAALPVIENGEVKP